MNEPASRVRVFADGLTKRFGDFVAVDHVSFEVSEGEIFGFLGPNGAGKTTTIKMLAGLLLPTSGRGAVAGLDIMTQTDTIKRNIGYMSQLFSLYADLTVEENIKFFSQLYNVPREQRPGRRDWVLEMAGADGSPSTANRGASAGLEAAACARLCRSPRAAHFVPG